MERKSFEFEIKQNIATLTEDEAAEYQKQLNIVSWQGARPSLDLRLWRITAEGQKPLKGLTLSAEEAGRLYNALDVWKGQFYEEKSVTLSHTVDIKKRGENNE